MQESSKNHHQTDYHGSASGFFFSGSAGLNINLLVTDFREAFASLIQLKSLSTASQPISSEQVSAVQSAVERFEGVLYKLGSYQKRVNELKEVHNMFHILEGALALLDRTIQRNLRRKTILNTVAESSQRKDLVDESWDDVKEHWTGAVIPIIKKMEKFATTEMRFLGEPHLVISASSWSGPEWILWLLKMREDFEASYQERSETIHTLSFEILNDCRDHLAEIDQQLRSTVNQLNPIFDQILGSIHSDSASS